MSQLAPVQLLLQTLQRVPFHCSVQSQPPGIVQVPRPVKQPAAQMAIFQNKYERETLLLIFAIIRTSRTGGPSPALIAGTLMHKHQ
jgi:hypothetical protein